MNKIKKYVIGSGLIAILALAMLVSVPQAKAADVNILVGQDLTLGSTGQNVEVLQGLLAELGYFNMPIGVSYGYFGTLTKNALARYQAAVGVSPAVGYYGPVTKTTLHSTLAPHGWLTLLGW